MKRVLIFEDDTFVAASYVQVLNENGYETHHVEDVESFNKLFYKDKDWDVIVFDAWIDKDDAFTYKCVEWVSDDLKDQVKLVANSSSAEYNQRLVNSGCHMSSGRCKFMPTQLVDVVCRLTHA
jgi:DNA-binding NtrC family response regulator